MLKVLMCSIIGHRLTNAGDCPFTGKSYDVCTRCTKMIEVKNV
jgi:hypothetical protein